MPGIPKENLEELWPLAERYFINGDKYGELDIKYHKDNCFSGESILWMSRNGKVAVILSVSKYKNGKECNIIMIAGKHLNTWIDELSEIEGWAARAGCDRMILTGRKGWQKILPEYEIKTLTMVKILCQ